MLFFRKSLTLHFSVLERMAEIDDMEQVTSGSPRLCLSVSSSVGFGRLGEAERLCSCHREPVWVAHSRWNVGHRWWSCWKVFDSSIMLHQTQDTYTSRNHAEYALQKPSMVFGREWFQLGVSIQGSPLNSIRSLSCLLEACDYPKSKWVWTVWIPRGKPRMTLSASTRDSVEISFVIVF